MYERVIFSTDNFKTLITLPFLKISYFSQKFMKEGVDIHKIIPELEMIVENYASQISRFKTFYQENGGNFELY